MITQEELQLQIKEAIIAHAFSTNEYWGIPGTANVAKWTLVAMGDFIMPLLKEIEDLKKLSGLKPAASLKK